ncbi:MAG: hypothetical protein J0L88_12965 [Xanthomonadales bacterium]|nr:hypothetical protein [Xanthomonadales bacterium]
MDFLPGTECIRVIAKDLEFPASPWAQRGQHERVDEHTEREQRNDERQWIRHVLHLRMP